MADLPVPTLDYASPRKPLPPPNDAIGLPRREQLNQPARYAALLTVTSPFVYLLRGFAPESVPLAFLAGGGMFVVACGALVLAVAGLRALSYAGRTGPVVAVCLVCFAAGGLLALGALGAILFPFGVGH
jgi:hypothetical protein